LEAQDHAKQQHPSNPDAEWLASASTLQSATRYVARSTGASSQGDGSSEEFTASASALLDWGIENKLIRPQGDFSFFGRPPDAHGDEHEVWFDQELNRWYKATYPDRFGLAWGRDGSATPLEYLSRLVLQNAYFGDDIRLICILNCRNRLRVLTSQAHITGDAAKYTEIREWFTKAGFRRLVCNNRIAWYLRAANLLVADAHEGNVIRTASGTLIPIDLNITQPTGELLQWALSESKDASTPSA